MPPKKAAPAKNDAAPKRNGTKPSKPPSSVKGGKAATPATSNGPAPSASPKTENAPSAPVVVVEDSSAPTQNAFASSRIIVRNLPKYITPERFREHFSKKGIVTDAKLAKTSTGYFRRFGFIGFKNVEDAKASVDYFNNTFIDTSKIQVEFARSFADPSLPRPWSRHSEGSSAHIRSIDAKKQAVEAAAQEEEKRKAASQAVNPAKPGNMHRLGELLNADEHDPKLKEFLEVMRPRGGAKARTWANDDAEDVKGANSRSVVQAVPDPRDDEYDDLPAMPDESAEPEPSKNPVKPVDTKPDRVVVDSTVSDADYFKARMKSFEEDDEDGFGADHDKMDDDEGADSNQDEGDREEGDEDVEMWDEDDETSQRSEPGGTKSTASDKPLTGKQKIAESIRKLFDDPDSKTSDSKTSDDAPERAKLKEELGDEPVPAVVIGETGRLFVRNMPYTCTPEDLEALFGKFGPISEVHIPIEKDTKKPKGFAFVLFMIPEHAVNAYISLDKKIFQGRILEILPGNEKPPAKGDEDLGPNASYKKKLEQKRKKNAGKDEFSWNSLFMNSDSVVEAMARKLGVTKSAIMDPTSENLAVRLALAETEIIAETKEYLESEGINVAAFEPSVAASSDSVKQPIERSKTVIIVKNIPASTTYEELESLFAAHGTLGRILLPPSHAIAIVEFLEANEAKSAFRKLAYTQFGGRPLFLEFAPAKAFKAEYDPAMTAAKRSSSSEADSAPAGQTRSESKKYATPSGDDPKPATRDAIMDEVAPEIDNDDTNVSTLFLKNLNFSTTEQGLMDFLSKALSTAAAPTDRQPSRRQRQAAASIIRSVRIPRKPDPKHPGQFLSMGFGFVEFFKRDDAVRAVRLLQGVEVDGHSLSVKFSNGSTGAAASGKRRNQRSGGDDEYSGDEGDGAGKKTGTKVVVRNVPFEATKSDLRQLFASIGTPKSVRLPRKFDGTHRGFGFVEFLTKQDAQAAFKALASTHLYGRHLVLEWADTDNDGTAAGGSASVEKMRKRTAKAFFSGDAGAPPAKRKRIETIAGVPVTEADA